MSVPFNKPVVWPSSQTHIQATFGDLSFAGNQSFSKKCSEFLVSQTQALAVHMVPSCTAALEASGLLIDIQPGDEVIVPSNTFVTSASAFVMRGAVPVFVDCAPDTLNITLEEIEAAYTKKTKAIIVVHYAGVGCEMDEIMEFASHHNIVVIEDAAQGVGSKYRGRALGTIGAIGTFSFHETKNIACGEGGALLVNRQEHLKDAEIICEKGTNRAQFFRGETDKYTWQKLGSSYLLGELPSALLLSQLEKVDEITSSRVASWQKYYGNLAFLQDREFLRLPTVPDHCAHNGHMFYVLIAERYDRQKLLAGLAEKGISCTSHYVPLHSSPAGKIYGRVSRQMTVTDDISERLVRLPMFYGISTAEQDKVVQILADVMIASA